MKPISLDDLPHFTIDHVLSKRDDARGGCLTGQFPDMRGVRNDAGWLYRLDRPSVVGRLENRQRITVRRVQFRPRPKAYLMPCIYCLQDASASRGVPHVIPEALGQNDFALPVGAVCDYCNQYLGHELDSVLAEHPVVSLFVQFLELPGKEGKLRKKLGNVARDVHPRTITIPTERPIIRYENGRRTATASIVVPRNFSLSRFRRALHHVALNLIAKHYGCERALDARFNAVRKYVRKPDRAERWAFAQHVDFEKGLSRELSLGLAQEEEAEIVTIGIADAAIFAVDLLNTGKLATWAKRELPAGVRVVDAQDDVPRESRRKDGKEYRLSICLDE